MAALVTTHDLKLLSLRGAAAVTVLTAGDGPFLFGIMPADLSLTELEEYLEINGPLTPSDIVGMERASRGRVIRTVALLEPSGNGTVAGKYFDNKGLSAISIPEDAGGIVPWLYNMGQAMTTGAILRFEGQFFGEFST